MVRRYYHKTSYAWVWKLLALVFAGWVVYWGYNRFFVFDPDDILKKSVLKEKNFNTEVAEVTSPDKKIKAYLFRDTTNPIISISFLFKNAGVASDDEKHIGIANAVAALLTEGAGGMDGLRFKEELERKAIGMSFSANLDDFTGSLITTKEHQDTAYQMLNAVFREPRFDEQDIRRVKAQLLTVLKQQREHPAGILELAAAKEIFGNHPYSRNPAGTEKGIGSITRADLLEFVHNHFTKSNLMVGIAGDVTEEEAGAILDRVFGNLPDNGRIVFVRDSDTVFDGRVKNISYPSAQSVSEFFGRGVARSHPDFYPLYIANHIFGGSGLSSRLSLSARENEALTYSIYTYLSLLDKAPTIRGGFSSTPENFARVMEIVRREWQKMGREGVSEAELEQAKNYLISSYNLRFASIATIADILVYMQKDNLGADFLQKRNDYVRNVKLKDVNRAAKEYFGSNDTVFVNIGNFGDN